MDRGSALLDAFELVEAVQGEDPAAALSGISEALLGAEGWPDVRFVLLTGRTVFAIVRPGVLDADQLVEDLLLQAPEPAATAIALGLKALIAAGRGDTATLLACTSRAVALLDDTTLAPRERCLAYVVNAAALNTLRLWELVDELYACAVEDVAAARDARQLQAVGINRVTMGLEHGLSLLEIGRDDEAYARLRAAADLVPVALEHDLRPLWASNARAALAVVELLTGGFPDVSGHLADLRDQNDLEVLPHLEAALALAAWRRDGTVAAADASPLTATSGARSFPLWVRAQVLADDPPSAAVVAQRAHAQLIDAALWEARSAVLSSARAQITAERRRAEHERLQRAVHTDPLTGLHNRRRFDDWLQRPGAGPTALLLLDLDGFKKVNDVFGHDCGDDVLRRIGLQLRAAVRPGDLAVRQGGDEFAVVLQDPDLTDASALARAEEIARAVAEEPWDLVAPGLSVRVSIGIALALVEPGEAAGQALYREADRALYRAKREALPPVLAGSLNGDPSERGDR